MTFPREGFEVNQSCHTGVDSDRTGNYSNEDKELTRARAFQLGFNVPLLLGKTTS